MNEPKFQDVPNTCSDLVDITVDGETIRVRNSHIVDQAVEFLCKCTPDVRQKIISELANPNQRAVLSALQPVSPCCRVCASFVPLPAGQN